MILYSSKYEAILKILLLYLVELVWRNMLSTFDFLLGEARQFGFLVGNGAVFFLQ